MQRGAQKVSMGLILGLAAACVTSGEAESGKKDDEAAAAATDVCDIARYLAFAEAYLSNKIGSYRTATNHLKTTALATQMLAEKLRGSAAFKGAQLLSILAHSRSTSADQATEDRQTQLTKATRVINRQIGLAIGYGKTATGAVKQGTAPNTAAANEPASDGVSTTQQPTLTAMLTGHCDLTTAQTTSKVKQADVKLTETKSIPLLDPAKIQPAAVKLTAYAKGTPAASQTKDASNSWVTKDGTSSHYLGAKIDVTAATAYVKKQGLYDETKPQPACAQPQQADINKQTELGDAAATICTAIRSPDPDTTGILDQSFDAIATTSKAQTVAVLILGQTKKPTDEGQATKQVKDLLGGSEANYQRTYVKAVKTTQITVDINGVKTTDTLLKLAEKAESADVLAFLIGQNKGIQEKASVDNTESPKKEENVEKTTNKGVDDKTGTDCKATEEGKCDKEKCAWNKEKNECKVKDGTVIISSVINAPLLLAVLLL